MRFTSSTAIEPRFLKNTTKIAKPDNIALTLVRGDPKEKVNLNLDMNLYKEAIEYRNKLFY